MSATPTSSSKETKQSIATLEQLLHQLSISKSQDEANGAAGNVATFLNGPIEEHDVPLKAVEILKKQLANKKDAVVRERALDGIRAVASHSTIAPGAEPYLISLLPLALAAVGDKMVSVKNAAQAASLAIVKAINPNAVK
ncbi:elongation factor 3, partial [Aspergillus sclerotialis]